MNLVCPLLSLSGIQSFPDVAFDGIDLAGHLLRDASLPELVNKLQAALRKWEEDVDE